MLRVAQQMAESGQYVRIFIDKSWRHVTGRKGSFMGREPDIIGVRKDGRYDAVEIASETDSVINLRTRLSEAMNELPRSERGQIRVVEKPIYEYKID